MPLAAKKKERTSKVTPAELEAAPVVAEEAEEQSAQPKVTALVYSYDNAPALRTCLAALEASTARTLMEILVVDKGSQDESPGLDAEFPNSTFLRLPRNFGNTKALNIGMRTAVGELVFFLCPEAEVAPDTVSKLMAWLDADSDSVAVCPLITDEKAAPVEQAYRLPGPQSASERVPVLVSASSTEPTVVECASFQAMMARKYFIRGINYLDDRFGEFGADAELGFQVRRAGRKIKILPDIRVVRSPLNPPKSSS